MPASRRRQERPIMSHAHQLHSVRQARREVLDKPLLEVFPTYRIDNDRGKHRASHRLPISWILRAADHAVVVCLRPIASVYASEQMLLGNVDSCDCSSCTSSEALMTGRRWKSWVGEGVGRDETAYIEQTANDGEDNYGGDGNNDATHY